MDANLLYPIRHVDTPCRILLCYLSEVTSSAEIKIIGIKYFWPSYLEDTCKWKTTWQFSMHDTLNFLELSFARDPLNSILLVFCNKPVTTLMQSYFLCHHHWEKTHFLAQSYFQKHYSDFTHLLSSHKNTQAALFSLRKQTHSTKSIACRKKASYATCLASETRQLHKALAGAPVRPTAGAPPPSYRDYPREAAPRRMQMQRGKTALVQTAGQTTA